MLIQNLKNAIEDNFREKHSASEYADLLHLTSGLIEGHPNRYKLRHCLIFL
ncbi:hypothetical protein IM792_17375 [Mucilaginibacter sp. JRF]|uniref:hypothetical protein n=1 Tax=Mucilaginibacter sp. JRF TaxID=2780088 RepID=UPI00187F6E04|nr:hypothetical protein [Mucilaginibacter sp. JRF]MBE9586229.1 hypothetical protein [Mucilaginibacter sp. JRF]